MMITSTLFFVLVFTVHFSIVFIKDVILFDTELNVNEQGALNPKKALKCEHAVYLFNPSEVWANTGVRLNKGDKFRINFSGGTNTSIYEAVKAAKNNIKPRFDRVRYDSTYIKKQEDNRKYCLSKGTAHLGSDGRVHKFNFGTIMYTVQPESANVIYNPLSVPAKDLRSWNPGDTRKNHDADRDFHEAGSSGFLYLAVNDIIFGDYDDSLSFKNDPKNPVDRYFVNYLRRIEIEQCEYSVKLSAESSIDDYFFSDSTYFYNIARESLKKGEIFDAAKIRDSLKFLLKNDHMFFYKDNIGQILVSVEIQRSEPGSFFNPMMAYRDFETNVAGLPEADVNACWLIKLLFFLVDIVVFIFWLLVFGLHILVLYALGALKLWAIIVIIFLMVNTLQRWFYGKKASNSTT